MKEDELVNLFQNLLNRKPNRILKEILKDYVVVKSKEIIIKFAR